MSKENALLQIKSSGIGKAIYFTARELLDITDASGALSMTKEHFMQLSDTRTWSAARAQLGALAKAGIIEFTTNSHVALKFLAFDLLENLASDDNVLENLAQNEGDARFSSTGSQNDAKNSSAAKNSSTAQSSDVSDSDGGIGLVGIDHDPHSTGDLKPTNPEPQQPQPASFVSLTDDQQAAYDLLTDSEIRMNPKSALDLCQKHTLVWVAQQTATYWQELKDKTVRGPGALVNRLTPGSGFSPSPITDDFRRSEVYRRHNLGALFAEAERAERRAAYASMENYEPQRSSYVVADEYADVVIG